MNDKLFIKGFILGGLVVAMVALAISSMGCAMMQPGIPTQQAVEYDTLRALNAAQQTYLMYQEGMPANERDEVRDAINKVYGMLTAYRALTAVNDQDTMALIKAKDQMIDLIAKTTGVTK